jgi:hypothetical protein
MVVATLTLIAQEARVRVRSWRTRLIAPGATRRGTLRQRQGWLRDPHPAHSNISDSATQHSGARAEKVSPERMSLGPWAPVLGTGLLKLLDEACLHSGGGLLHCSPAATLQTVVEDAALDSAGAEPGIGRGLSASQQSGPSADAALPSRRLIDLSTDQV